MKTLNEIFSNVTLIGQTPSLILKAQLPDKIFDEVKSWVEPCRAIKDDEYAELLTHRNVGTHHNSYQTAIPRKFIDNTFFFGYILHFAELYLDTSNVPDCNENGGYYRRSQMRGYPGHFDGYDIWMNFTYKGDDNPMHNHAGSLSSIIYVKDEDCQPTIFPTINYTHKPKEGEILLFPSNLLHSVDVKETESERISVSFNLDVHQPGN
jgi:hypothetical protein